MEKKEECSVDLLKSDLTLVVRERLAKKKKTGDRE
jgi:hypothetical protein